MVSFVLLACAIYKLVTGFGNGVITPNDSTEAR